ncbi:thiamine diphosphokinase [Bacillus salitolerans]|uniref:Thiamine diphosphokinase n=1 Tax=Bacillus salitolerans TaxID=1437434 RepID=A0ABW4LKZ1_9BACI
MIIHIVAGGPIENIPDLSQYNLEDVRWVGVDRGLLYILKNGIKPTVGLGDFDSVSKEELAWMQQQCKYIDISPAEKDETDNELALSWSLSQNPSIIRIFGATGGRLDHELMNFQLLYKGIKEKIFIEVIDHKNRLTMLSPGTYSFNRTNCYKYISFLPFTNEVKGITLKGFKYPLTNHEISWGTTLCVSNEILEESGTFSFTDGIVIMVKSKD